MFSRSPHRRATWRNGRFAGEFAGGITGVDDISCPAEFVHRQNPQLGSNVQALLAEIRTVGPIDVAEHGNLYVVNFHENRNASDSGRPLMNNVLVVVDRKRQKVVFSTVLDEALRQLVPESFFIHGNLLFCIAGRHTLLALPLSQDDDRTALT